MDDTYRILRPLENSPDFPIYLMESQSTNALRVILKADISSLSRKDQTRILRDAQLLQQLSHPNLLTIHDAYRTTHMKLCLVTEYAEGGSLASCLVGLQGTVG